jgi:hypothetical protein
MSGKGLIPTSKSVEIRLQYVTMLNPRMRLRQEAEVRNYKLIKIDPRTLDERMNFFTEIQVRSYRRRPFRLVCVRPMCVRPRFCVRSYAGMRACACIGRGAASTSPRF